MYRPYIQQIIDATNKCIKEIRKAINKKYSTGRIKASRKHFKCATK